MAIEHRYPLLQQGFITPKITTASSSSLIGNDSGKAFVNTGSSGTTTYLLPKASPGYHYMFVETAAHNMVITPINTDAFRGSSAGVSKTLSGLGQNFLITCVTPGFWELF